MHPVLKRLLRTIKWRSLTLDWAREPWAHLRYAFLSFKFLLSMQSHQNVIHDCFGNVYWRVPMRGNGFWGFNSLSYSLTGNQQNYTELHNDFANVFVNVPDLFRTRTNFGARLDPSLTVDDYMIYMRVAIDRVHRGLSAGWLGCLMRGCTLRSYFSVYISEYWTTTIFTTCKTD